MQRLKHIIWDWNGTLLNDAPFACRILNILLERRGLPTLDYPTYQRIYDFPIELIYERTGFNLTEERFEDISNEWHSEYVLHFSEVELHHDSLDTLQAIRARGITQSILSALPHDILLESLELHGVSSCFAHVLGSEGHLSVNKRDNGLLLMSRLGATTQDTMLIGDTAHDAETAVALGIRCLLVARGFEDRERLLQHGVAVIDDFNGLLEHTGLLTPGKRD